MSTPSIPENDASGQAVEYGALRPLSFAVLGFAPILILGNSETLPFFASFGWLTIAAVLSLAVTFAYVWWLFEPYFRGEKRRMRVLGSAAITLLFSPYLLIIFKGSGSAFAAEDVIREARILRVEIKKNSGNRLSQCTNFVTIEFPESNSPDTFCADGVTKRMLNTGPIQLKTKEGWAGFQVVDLRVH